MKHVRNCSPNTFQIRIVLLGGAWLHRAIRMSIVSAGCGSLPQLHVTVKRVRSLPSELAGLHCVGFDFAPAEVLEIHTHWDSPAEP